MSILLNRILTPATGVFTDGGPFKMNKTYSYSGSWVLNTATSMANVTNTQVTTAASQWTLVTSQKNMNPSALLNSAGAFVAPVDGTYTVCLEGLATSNNNITVFESWFTYVGAAGTYGPRIAWSRCTTAQTAATTNSVRTISLNKNDVLIPTVYATNTAGTATSLFANANAAPGTGAGLSPPNSTQLSITLINQTN